jgi:DNA mismatch repair protein MutS
MTEVEERLASDKLTPMMRQYLGTKAEYPGAVVLYRMGDFFETFYEDAETCAQILDLTLTARSKERDIPMAGVPHHAIDGYLTKLIEAGKTVVMVDQIEDPKLAKGLVKRAVTRVLSPGTYLDPQAPARALRYLVAVTLEEKKKALRFGLSALDLSTGEFRATGGESVELLTDELSRLGMKEIVLPEALKASEVVAGLQVNLHKVVFTFLEEKRYPPARAAEALGKLFGAEEQRALAQHLDPLALTAAGLALRYTEESQLRPEAPDLHGRASLAHVQKLVPYVPGAGLVLDTECREHLELFQSQGEGGRRGSLIGAIDEAKTGMGGRLLQRWLAYPLAALSPIRARQDAIEALIAAPSELDRLRNTFAGVGDLERLIGRVMLARATPRDLVALAVTLVKAPEALGAAKAALKGELTSSAEERLAILSAVDPLPDLAARISAALLDDPTVDLESGQVFRPGFDAELDRLQGLAQNGKQLIAELEAKEKARTGISSLKIRYNKVFGYYLEVTRTNLKLVPKDYIRKQTTVNAERYYTEELKTLETEVLTADEQRIARTVALYQALLAEVAKEAVRLHALAEALAELDVLSALAELAERRAWCRPLVDDGGTLEIVEGRHPVIELYSKELGERFVPNDLTLTPDQRLMIITGPNMAGKSTIMRQTALIAILAHLGSYVPAKSARIGLLDRIYTRVGASDDLSRGRSTFMVEMTETARILRAATPRSLVLLDEIGRGTSTFDGLSIAWAVAEHLHDVAQSKTLFATHYHELTEISRIKPHALNRHVAVREYNDQIVFLRKLAEGATNRSYGVQVARLAGLPKGVVERARQVLDGLEAQALRSGGRGKLDVTASQLVALRGRGPGPRGPVTDGGPDPGALRTLELDDLSPRAAHQFLAELQARLEAPLNRRALTLLNGTPADPRPVFIRAGFLGGAPVGSPHALVPRMPVRIPPWIY